MNLTPLIDVVFVILIAFIVLAPLLELDRVELADASEAPQDRSVSVQEASPIAIYVRQDNAIIVNGQPVTLAQLTDYLKQAKTRYPNAKPQLFHDSLLWHLPKSVKCCRNCRIPADGCYSETCIKNTSRARVRAVTRARNPTVGFRHGHGHAHGHEKTTRE